MNRKETGGVVIIADLVSQYFKSVDNQYDAVWKKIELCWRGLSFLPLLGLHAPLLQREPVLATFSYSMYCPICCWDIVWLLILHLNERVKTLSLSQLRTQASSWPPFSLFSHKIVVSDCAVYFKPTTAKRVWYCLRCRLWRFQYKLCT